MNMALAEAVKTVEPTYTINDSMDVLLGKLDEATDDMENGRVQTIDEAWDEIDRVQGVQMAKRYKVVIAQSGKMDVMNKKRYIIENFKYRDYVQNFSAKIKKAEQVLDTLPTGYETTGFQYRGYDIYMKPNSNHLLFYTVDEEKMVVTVLRVLQDGMDWEYIIKRRIESNMQERC